MQLSDVAIDVSGQRIVAVKDVEVDYSVFTIVSKGVVLDQIKLVEPQLLLEQADGGWNLGGLVKQQRQEADRKGPGRPIELQSIEISDGSLVVDQNRANGYNIPDRISDLDVQATFEYAPVHYSLRIASASFKGQSPQLTLQQLKGQIGVRDDNLYLEDIVIRTDSSSISVDGVIRDYLNTPVLELTTTANVSMREIGGVVPAAAGYSLQPAAHVTANGPAGPSCARLRRPLRSGERERPGHCRCQGARAWRQRQGADGEPESRAAAEGPRAEEQHYGHRETRSDGRGGASRYAGARPDVRQFPVRRAARRGGRLRGDQRARVAAGSREDA